MGQIDTIGTYILEVVEAGITTTKERGYPQLVLRAKALQRYIETPADLAHYSLPEPSYVDWSPYGEDTLAYLVLFKSADSFTADTALLNYEQAQKAFGWAGDDFSTIAKPGQKFLGRFEENTYNNKTSIQLQWIDAADASPNRQLKTLDTATVTNLSKLLKAGIGKSAAPAKPKPAVAKPGTTVPKAPAPADATPASESVATPVSPSKGTQIKPPVAKSLPPVSTEPSAADGAPDATTQLEAWDFVISRKGGNEDKVVEETWLAACGEIGAGRTEDKFTPQDWAKIRNIVVRDLAL